MDSQSKRGLLVIAPVGDPTAWRLAEYRIGGRKVKSCCSATAIVTANTEKHQRESKTINIRDRLPTLHTTNTELESKAEQDPEKRTKRNAGETNHRRAYEHG
ncbi:hypothetical protein HRbin02_00135 [Candidatus Calditenuaceae archaeon HR02]|nr:hypothetical protein HRbin02_00135 [Candidatus Calditenuaceae archaeon HR02]